MEKGVVCIHMCMYVYISSVECMFDEGWDFYIFWPIIPVAKTMPGTKLSLFKYLLSSTYMVKGIMVEKTGMQMLTPSME